MYIFCVQLHVVLAAVVGMAVQQLLDRDFVHGVLLNEALRALGEAGFPGPTIKESLVML